MVARKKPEIEVDEPVTPAWWDDHGVSHPMTDEEFATQFCAWAFTTTTDADLKIMRTRAYRFISCIMQPELRQALDAYREVHPL